MDDKEYLTPDPGLGTSHSTLKEGHVPHLISEMDWDAIENEARAYSIADRLVEMRVSAGLSQKDMAVALNCRQPRIAEIESTPNEKMSLKSISRYVEVTRKTLDVVLQDGKRFVMRPAPKKSKSRELAYA